MECDRSSQALRCLQGAVDINEVMWVHYAYRVVVALIMAQSPLHSQAAITEIQKMVKSGKVWKPTLFDAKFTGSECFPFYSKFSADTMLEPFPAF